MKYFELVSSLDMEGVRDVEARLKDPSTNPSHIKRRLARDIVTQYYDEKAAQAAEEQFDTIHVLKDTP